MITNLRQIREKRGMTQEELAKESGVSRMVISSLENGKKTNVTYGTIQKLSKVLNTKPDKIFSI